MIIRRILILLIIGLPAISFAQTLTTEPEPILRILTYGFPPDNEYIAARATVAKKWGIEFYMVAGCIVSKKLGDSVSINNSKIEKLIVAKYGSDWRERFEKEVEDAEFVVRALEDKIAQYDTVIKVENALGEIYKKEAMEEGWEYKEQRWINYLFFSNDAGTNYTVFLYEQPIANDNENGYVVYFEFDANPITKEIKLVSSELRPFSVLWDTNTTD